MTSRTYTVDDADSQIRYSDGWTKEGSGQEFNTTTAWTATRGAFFTFTFLGMNDVDSLAPITNPSMKEHL